MSLKMPLKHILKDLLAITLHDISMARDHGDKVPLSDALHALVEAVLVLGCDVPVETPQPLDVTTRVLHTGKDLADGTVLGNLGFGNLAVLLGGWQVEEQVGLDDDTLGLVQEDDLKVGVAVDVLVVKVGVELGIDANLALVILLEDDSEFLVADLGVVLLLGALLRETLGTDELCRGVRLCPLRDKDVVLVVKGDDVTDVAAHLCDLGLSSLSEGHGGEDSEATRGELHHGAPAANLNLAVAGKGYGESGDVGSDVADDHDVLRL